MNIVNGCATQKQPNHENKLPGRSAGQLVMRVFQMKLEIGL